ncbi:MAG: nucleotide exchange factor GrpE [Patescibacteria group bacterium]
MTDKKKKKSAHDSNEELEKLQNELAQMTETAQRTLADLQNYKRRVEEERGELQIFANMKFLEAIFPAIDNLARAFEHVPAELQGNEWLKGVQSIEKNLLHALENLGLESIDKSGIPMDPHQHEVVMEAPGPRGEVLQVFEKGFAFKGKTVRPAKVQVGSGD